MRLGHGLLLLGVALPLLHGCGDASSKVSEVRPVRTIVIDPKPIMDDRRAVGEVRPRYESELGFLVSGKMIVRTVDVGAVVKKGDLLARLDDQDYRNRLRSAEADLVAGDAALVEAQNAEDRYRQLLANGYTTRALYDSALKNLRSAQAKLDSAKAALDMAKDQVNYSELRAEFDGVITAVGAEAGQVVNSGRMIVRVAKTEDKDAVFSIAETAFQGRQTAGEQPRIVVALLSNPDILAEGIVREVSPIADPATRTFQVKVTLNGPPEQMRFGASVAGRLKGSSAAVVVLPASALFDKEGGPAVWVVDPATGGVTLRPVTVDRYETDRVILRAGLVKGEIVVTAGVNRLRENQKVRVSEDSL